MKTDRGAYVETADLPQWLARPEPLYLCRNSPDLIFRRAVYLNYLEFITELHAIICQRLTPEELRAYQSMKPPIPQAA
jgi:hypothetical protein